MCLRHSTGLYWDCREKANACVGTLGNAPTQRRGRAHPHRPNREQVDFIPVKAVAFRDLPYAYIPDWMESLKRVEAMDFDILLPEHGALGAKQQAGIRETRYCSNTLARQHPCYWRLPAAPSGGREFPVGQGLDNRRRTAFNSLAVLKSYNVPLLPSSFATIHSYPYFCAQPAMKFIYQSGSGIATTTVCTLYFSCMVCSISMICS